MSWASSSSVFSDGAFANGLLLPSALSAAVGGGSKTSTVPPKSAISAFILPCASVPPDQLSGTLVPPCLPPVLVLIVVNDGSDHDQDDPSRGRDAQIGRPKNNGLFEE